MYKLLELKNQISNVKSFENKAFYCIFSVVYDESNLLIAEDVECQSFWVKGLYILYHNKAGDRILKNISSQLATILSFSPFFSTINNENVLGSFDQKFNSNRFDWKVGYFNIQRNLLIREIPSLLNCHIFLQSMDNVICVDRNKKLSSFSLSSSTFLWKFDFMNSTEIDQKPCEFEKFIGVWENQFLFSCKNNTVLSIHIETGELIHQWYDMPPIVSLSVEYNTIQDSMCITLDEKRGELVGLHSFMYLKIDLKTKEITSRCLDDILAKNNLNLLNDLSNCLITETHYVTTGETPWVAGLHRGTEVLLAMNKDTLEIDWKFEFDENVWLSNNQPEMGLDKLYQLDMDGNLYVFQKE